MNSYNSMLDLEPGVALLIIDPQIDFHPGGSLAIPSANQDSARVADLIRNYSGISEIYVTLDSHERYHIAHPLFWVDSSGKHPAPFEKISKQDVASGKWKATQKKHQDWAMKYVTELEKQGNFTLNIWPEHCLIGTTGHAVTPIIATALAEWEEKKARGVHYYMKGNNSLTEHYSAMKAEVAIDKDGNTKLNTELLDMLKQHSEVFICGQALSHCVNFTTRDICNNWDQSKLNQLVVLKDASSAIAGFENEGFKFLEDMKEKGLQLLEIRSLVSGHSETGCYVWYSHEHNGSLVAEWRRTAPKLNHLLFFTTPLRVWQFKFNSPIVLAEGLKFKPQNRFQGFAQYLHEAVTFNGTLRLGDAIFEGGESNDGPSDVHIYGFQDGRVIPIKPRTNDIEVRHFSALAVVPKTYNGLKNARNVTPRQFLSLGSKGASFTITKKHL